MDDTASIEMGTVAAAEIDKREFSTALGMNECVATRHLGRCENHIVVLCPAKGKRLADQRERAIPDIQPGDVSQIDHLATDITHLCRE